MIVNIVIVKCVARRNDQAVTGPLGPAATSECLEETLLHTFEPAGGGVASPHTTAQLKHVGELKRRHPIDYDTHASYRFRELR